MGDSVSSKMGHGERAVATSKKRPRPEAGAFPQSLADERRPGDTS